MMKIVSVAGSEVCAVFLSNADVFNSQAKCLVSAEWILCGCLFVFHLSLEKTFLKLFGSSCWRRGFLCSFFIFHLPQEVSKMQWHYSFIIFGNRLNCAFQTMTAVLSCRRASKNWMCGIPGSIYHIRTAASSSGNNHPSRFGALAFSSCHRLQMSKIFKSQEPMPHLPCVTVCSSLKRLPMAFFHWPWISMKCTRWLHWPRAWKALMVIRLLLQTSLCLILKTLRVSIRMINFWQTKFSDACYICILPTLLLGKSEVLRF